ncbi:Di-copper centre-containing protein, partial [Ramicandelaber brevisporus]
MYLRFLLTALRAFRTLLLIVIVLIIPALNAQSANSTSSNGDCKFTKLRREIRDLSQADIDRLIKALSIMRTTASPTMPGMSKWEAFIQWHSMNQREVHVDPKFFVFHRAFVNLFENELRRIDPDIEGLPYWNLAVDALSPENNTIPTRKSSGGSGGSSNSSNSTAFKTSCIMRGFDPKDTSKRWQSLDVVDMTIRESKQYRDFRQQIEFGIHANAHNFIGGTMLYPWSPADSMVFFTLHSYVDKLWADWQDLHDKDRGSNYEG